MELLTAREQEELKKNDPSQHDWAAYHRFIESSSRSLFPKEEPRLHPEIHPTFETYKKWLREYDGWSYGKLRWSHSAWKPEYAARELPMNQLYADSW